MCQQLIRAFQKWVVWLTVLFSVCFVRTVGYTAERLKIDLPENHASFDGVPDMFHSEKEIREHFEKRSMLREIKIVKKQDDVFCFVLAARSPSDSMDISNLYCFVQGKNKNGEVWGKLLKAVLAYTWNNVEFEPNGDFVDVIHNGVVVLKYNPEIRRPAAQEKSQVSNSQPKSSNTSP
jgi:hypothetical protein